MRGILLSGFLVVAPSTAQTIEQWKAIASRHAVLSATLKRQADEAKQLVTVALKQTEQSQKQTERLIAVTEKLFAEIERLKKELHACKEDLPK